MYEFRIVHIHCGMTHAIYGYDFYDACRRWNIDPKPWEVEEVIYCD